MCYMQLAEMKYMRDDEELNYAFFNGRGRRQRAIRVS